VREGVVELAGPVLGRGYAGGEAGGFTVRDGERWFVTADLGSWDGEHLAVHGRRDDVLVIGGVNVAPAAVEQVLAGLVGEVCVVGVPDERWGQVPVAVVVPGAGGPPTLEAVRDVIGRTLGSAAAPRRLVVVDALPVLGPGKVDRAAVARLVADA
jgi:O-succinylbenzoic acid--CoA ligase